MKWSGAGRIGIYLDGRVNRNWLLNGEGKPKEWKGMREGENELNSRMS